MVSITPKSEFENTSKSLPRVLALTGGIGSGKSTVREIFEALGVPCIDADTVARGIHQNPRHPATSNIARALPEAATPDGRLKRGSLCKMFAVDAKANNELRRILKPHVMAEIERWTGDKTTPYVVWESALIIEENIRSDRVLVIDASDETRLARIRMRNPDWTDEQIKNIFSIQLPRSSYMTRADDVILNEGFPQNLRAQIEELHRTYIKNWSWI